MKRSEKKAALPVLLAVVLALAALFTAFRFLFREKAETAIVLPESSAAEEPETDAGESTLRTGPDTEAAEDLPGQDSARAPDDTFLSLTTDSVRKILDDIPLPDAFYEAMAVTVAAGEGSEQHTVELWSKGGMLRARVSRNGSVTDYLRTEEGLTIWIEGEEEIIRIASPAADVEELCGVRVTTASVPDEQIQYAEYLTTSSGKYIYLETKQDALEINWWVDPDTGLVYMLQQIWDSAACYSVRQTDYRILTPADEAYTSAFLLPETQTEG